MDLGPQPLLGHIIPQITALQCFLRPWIGQGLVRGHSNATAVLNDGVAAHSKMQARVVRPMNRHLMGSQGQIGTVHTCEHGGLISFPEWSLPHAYES